MTTSNLQPYNLPQHRRLPEPLLKFGNDDSAANHAHPLLGLIQHGPFGKQRLAGVSNPIRIAFIGQAAMLGRLWQLVKELDQKHQPRERRTYLPEYPGFARVFETSLASASDTTTIMLPDDIDAKLSASSAPHRLLAECLTGALSSLQAHRHDFDVAMLGIDEKWAAGFEGTKEDDFDLHDFVKAFSASAGIPLQIVRSGNPQRALDYHCRCSVMWRLAIAMYTKAGGIPWALANTRADTAYIGIDYAIRKNATADARFAICCAQVFDSDGAGLDFIAYEADDIRIERRNPYMRKDQMLKVMARSLSIYQRRHGGALPKRVVVHKNTEFRSAEVEGCLAAFSNVVDVELIQVQRSHDWQGVIFSERNAPDNYPCNRGQVLPIGDHEALLWTQGNIPNFGNGKSYYKEGKGIPSPLLITRHLGRGDFFDICEETLALTKMNWNNDGPYTQLPVTLEYADVLAQIVKRMPRLEAKPYPVRLFM